MIFLNLATGQPCETALDWPGSPLPSLNDPGISYQGDFDDFWSREFPGEGGHPITESLTDIDYDSEQEIEAYYGMLDLPIVTGVNLIGGVRFARHALRAAGAVLLLVRISWKSSF